MKAIQFNLIVLVAAIFLTRPAAAIEPQPGYNSIDISRDLAWIRDTHASSSVKASAATRLGNLTSDYAAYSAAISALHRQSFYDGDSVRQAARDSLAKMLGPSGATVLLSTPPPAAAPLTPTDAEMRKAASILIDPFSADDAQIWARSKLIRAPLDGGSPLTPLIQQAQETSAKGRHSRIMLNWVLGVQETDTLLKIAPLQAGESFTTVARKKLVDSIKGWDELDRAEALTRSEREEFESLGFEMLEKMVQVNPGPALPEALARRVLAIQALGKSPRLASAESARTRLIAFKDARSFTPVGISLCLMRWDHPNPDVQKAARDYWQSMLVDGKLDNAAAAVLGEHLLTLTGEARERVLTHLDKATPGARNSAVARLLSAIASNDERAKPAETMLKRWNLDEAPLTQAARAVGAVSSRYHPELRRWFEGVIAHPETAAEGLSLHLSLGLEDMCIAAARIARLAPEQLKPTEGLIHVTKRGHTQSNRVILMLTPDPARVNTELAPLLESSDWGPRRAALAVFAAIGATPLSRPALERLLRSENDDERHLAMEALGTDDAKRIALTPELLANLRSRDPRIRSQAAHDARRLEIDRPAIMAALVQAVDAGDLATREGLVLALDRSSKLGQSAADVLAKADDEKDPTLRAYLKAGKRAAAGK